MDKLKTNLVWVNIREACEILGKEPLQVRNMCESGELKAVETIKNSGHWRIESGQLTTTPNWDNFQSKVENHLNASKELAESMIKLYEE